MQRHGRQGVSEKLIGRFVQTAAGVHAMQVERRIEFRKFGPRHQGIAAARKVRAHFDPGINGVLGIRHSPEN